MTEQASCPHASTSKTKGFSSCLMVINCFCDFSVDHVIYDNMNLRSRHFTSNCRIELKSVFKQSISQITIWRLSSPGAVTTAKHRTHQGITMRQVLQVVQMLPCVNVLVILWVRLSKIRQAHDWMSHFGYWSIQLLHCKPQPKCVLQM